MDAARKLMLLAADIEPEADPILWDVLREGTERRWGVTRDVRKTLSEALLEIVVQLGDEQENAGRDAMLEGVEWPRYDTGEPVRFGDEFLDHQGNVRSVLSVKMFQEGGFEIGTGQGTYDWLSAGERVRRPAPKVFDADGVEIREGDRVWSTQLDDPHEWIVIDPHEDRGDSQTVLVSIGDRTGHARPENLTHRAPVLAAGGEPLEVGQTVYDVDDEADTPLTVVEVSSDLVRCEYTWKDGKTYRPCYLPDQLTHTKPEPPDSAERIADDIRRMAEEWCSYPSLREASEKAASSVGEATMGVALGNLSKRCRALAERERGE